MAVYITAFNPAASGRGIKNHNKKKVPKVPKMPKIIVSLRSVDFKNLKRQNALIPLQAGAFLSAVFLAD
jgi:hypothetical protein